MNLLKKLASDWRDEAKGPTLSTHKKAAEAYARCATELESMLNAVEALTKFRKGNGTGLPHGTIAWVLMDGVRYIREWHPMEPASDGTPQGNWWPLYDSTHRMASIDGRFSEHEVSHYSVIEVPDMPTLGRPRNHRSRQPHGNQAELTAVVGKSVQTGNYVAFTILADLREGQPKLVEVAADSEEEALRLLQQRADAVLRTFLHDYRVVKL